MINNRYYSDFTEEELESGYNFMLSSIETNVKDPILYSRLMVLLKLRWSQFKSGMFSVDGATFVDEQKENFFNFWWFNHDARNTFGHVGKEVDNEMLDIMVLLNVPQHHFRQIIPWFYLTWVNVIRHKIKGTYKDELPTDLIRL